MMQFIMNEQGEVVRERNYQKWEAWMKATDRVIALAQSEGWLVRTTFIGEDCYTGKPPRVFSTYVDSEIGYRTRWFSTTRAEALHKHESIVTRLTASVRDVALAREEDDPDYDKSITVCEYCSGERLCRLRPDPYGEEIRGDLTPFWLCDRCARDAAAEI